MKSIIYILLIILFTVDAYSQSAHDLASVDKKNLYQGIIYPSEMTASMPINI